MSKSLQRILSLVAFNVCCWSLAGADMTLLGTHPTSALAGVPDLNTLKAYDGRIYMGHGEWNGYHAIVVACYNPITHAIESEFLAPTDSIGIFREIGGKLYIPSTDPVHYDEFADYSVLDGGVWRSFAPAGLFHAFDMGTLTGSDLWMVGSKSDSETSTRRAAAFRSIDDGRTWMDVGGGLTFTDRYYGSFAHAGKFHVRDSFFTNNTPIGVTLAPYDPIYKGRPYGGGTQEVILAIAGRMPGFPESTRRRLICFDGTAWSEVRTNIHDFAMQNSEVYTLEGPTSTSTEVWVGTSINTSNATWRQLPINSVTNGRSIEVLGDAVYVGDSRGRLWTARIDGTLLQPGPASLVNKMPDGFGRALSSIGATLAVGAPQHSSAAYLSGQVTVWEQSAGEWTVTQTIDPPQPIFSGLFGKDVALSGNALAVLEGGVRGELAKVHLYESGPAGWGLTQSLVHPFAHSIAMSANRLAVATASRLYIYTYGSGTNGFQATAETSLAHNIDSSVLYEPTSRVAMEDDIIAYGIVGDFSRQGGPGQVNIYERNFSGAWTLVTNLLLNTPPLPTRLVRSADGFGFALALDDNWLAAGAPRDDTAASQAGAVYMYERFMAENGTPVYALRQKIVCPLPQAEARFGESVSMAGGTLAVGTSGVDDRSERQKGRTFVYRRLGTNWAVIGQVTRPSRSTVGFGSEVLATTNGIFAGSRTTGQDTDLSQRLAINTSSNVAGLTDLSATHSVTTTAATSDSPLAYTLTASNRGPITATDIRLAFLLPSNLQVESVSSTAFSCTNTGFEVVCWLDRLDPNSGASISVGARATVTNACEAIRFAAEVWSAEVDPAPSNNRTIAMVNYHPAGVTLAEPADGTILPFASSMRITAIPDEPNQLVGLSLYANTNRLAGFTAGPYTYLWTNVTNHGTYQLTARATNLCGLVSTSVVTKVIVRENMPPKVSFLHPVNGTRIAEGTPVPIFVAASDEDTSPGRAILSANTTVLTSFRGPPYNYFWSNAPPATYFLTARVQDTGGAQTVVRVRVLIGPEEVGNTNWTVYNDHNAGPLTGATVNRWDIPGPAGVSGGALRNVVNGATTQASLLISRSAGLTRISGGTAPNLGTPADDVFSSYTDFTAGAFPNVPVVANEWVQYTFTGLDPNLRYNFRGTAVGGVVDYTNGWTVAELTGAGSFKGSHTSGCLTVGTGTIQSNQVAFNSGDNRNGEVVGWDNIRPALDGSLVVECRQYTGVVPGGNSLGSNGFALTAVRLEEVVVPINPAPLIETQPVSTAVGIGGVAQFTAMASAQGPVTYQWLRNGSVLAGATNAVLELSATSTNDAGSYMVIVRGETGSVASTPASLSLVQIAVDKGDGQNRARLEIHGPALQNYSIQKKDALSEEVSWSELSTFTLQSGAHTFIDETSREISKRFYRVVPLP